MVFLQIGAEVFKLEPFYPWIILSAIISLIAQIVILRYFYIRHYLLSFYVLLLVTVITQCYFVLIYNLLLYRELQNYYILTLYLVHGTGLLYSLSLVSSVKNRFWLKYAGISGSIVAVLMLSLLLINSFTQNEQIREILPKIFEWISFGSNFISLFYVLNFLNEKKFLTKIEKEETVTGNWLNAFKAAGLFAAIFLGINLLTATGRAGGPKDLISAKARELALPFEARIYVNSTGDTLRYRFMKPLNYDSTRKYPLVVCLHHGGVHGKDNVRQVEGSYAALFSEPDFRKQYPSFLFAPQCPENAYWGNVPSRRNIDQLVLEAMGALEKEFSVDEKRRYILGVSGGGFGSWHFISTRPFLFAAAIPICGGGNPKLAQRLVTVPIWAFHGDQDRLAPVSGSRDMIEAIKKAGGDPKYTEFAGAGHDIANQVNATPGLWEWFFTQKRN